MLLLRNVKYTYVEIIIILIIMTSLTQNYVAIEN
jgi:hypothetical protein